MPDRELGGVHPGPGIQFAQRVIVMAFLQEREIRRFGEVTLVVQQVKNAHRLLRDQMDDRQVVLRQTNGQSDYFCVWRKFYALRNNYISQINLTV